MLHEQLNYLPYLEARKNISSADVLLFRVGRAVGPGFLIAQAGRSEYYHAGMAAWWGSRLMCLDTVSLRGGRATLLGNQAAKTLRQIDVYSPRDAIFTNRWKIINNMLEITGENYGWASLVKAALLHLPVLRFFVKADTDDEANGSLPMCSQAVAKAYRLAGHDLVPNLADRHTEPADLGRSALLKYKFTIE